MRFDSVTCCVCAFDAAKRPLLGMKKKKEAEILRLRVQQDRDFLIPRLTAINLVFEEEEGEIFVGFGRCAIELFGAVSP